jgi:Protein of unknown function (DUF559)
MAIRCAVDAGRLHRTHRGVYAVGVPDLSREGRWHAAVLACGDSALLSHTAAGLLWRVLERWDAWPHVSVPTQAGCRPRRGLTLHRAATLQPADGAVHEGIPVTALPRTLIDLAGMVSKRSLKAAVRRAERLHRIDLAELHAHAEGPRNDFRRARLRRVLGFYVAGDVGEHVEAPFLELCVRYGLPLPETQVRIGPYRVDFVWEDVRLIVETDDADSHDTVIGRADDAIRDRDLAARGYEVARVRQVEILRGAPALARELRAARDRRATQLGRHPGSPVA